MIINRKTFLISILLIAAIIFAIIGVGLIVKGDNPTYTITSEYFLNENINFFTCPDSIIFSSSKPKEENGSKPGKTRISKFDPSTGNIISLDFSENQASCEAMDVLNGEIFLASSSIYVNSETYTFLDSIEISKYDNNLNPTNDKIILKCPNNISIRNRSLVVDKNGNFLLLNELNQDKSLIEKYDSSGAFITSFQCGDASSLTNLYKNSFGQIYTVTTGKSIYFINDDDSITSYDISKLSLPNSELSLPINFIDSETIINSAGDIYAFNLEKAELEFLYSTATNNDIACKYNNYISTLCGNVLLNLDKDTGSPISQFSLNTSPDILIYTNDPIDTINCITLPKDDNENITVEVISSKPDNVQYETFSAKDDAFIVTPEPKTYTLSEIKDLDECLISFDKDKLLLGKREKPIVKINSSNYEVILQDEDITVNNDNRLSFCLPDDITKGTYTISITGLCTPEGKPAKCGYSFTVIDDPTQPSSSESESKSSSSSSESQSSSSESETNEPSQPATRKIESSVYTIDRTNSTIQGIAPGTTLAQFKKNISYSGTIYAVKNNGSTIKSGKLGTGTKIHLMNSDIEFDCLTVIITGDLTGEGNINSNDVQKACNYMLGEDNLDEDALLAFDINHNGEVDPVDLVMLNRMANGTLKY